MKLLQKFKTLKRICNEELRWASKGLKSRIKKPMRIKGKNYIHIGNFVRILNGARIEAVRLTGSKSNYEGEVYIGDRTSIEQNIHIIAATKLMIGSDCVISSNVFISDCEHGYEPNLPILKQPLKVDPTKIGNHVFIGSGAKIMPGVSIGNNSVIGANAVVTRDVPENSVAVGIPAKVIKEK